MKDELAFLIGKIRICPLCFLEERWDVMYLSILESLEKYEFINEYLICACVFFDYAFDTAAVRSVTNIMHMKKVLKSQIMPT